MMVSEAEILAASVLIAILLIDVLLIASCFICQLSLFLTPRAMFTAIVDRGDGLIAAMG